MSALHPVFDQALAPFLGQAPFTERVTQRRIWNDDDVYIIEVATGRVIEQIPASMRKSSFARYEVMPGQAVLLGMQAKHLGWLQ
jgi:hypothetical protein